MFEPHMDKVLGIPVIPHLFKAANYSGPGTDLKGREALNQKGVNAIDEIARKHDNDYNKGSYSKKLIRKADNDMLSSLTSKMSIFHPIDTINALPAYIGIKGKTIAEDIGLTS